MCALPLAGCLRAVSLSSCSVHTLALCKYRLNRLTRLLDSLDAAAGDALCLEPAGPLAARASLVKAAAAAAEVAVGEEGEQQQEQRREQQQEQPTPSDHSMPGTPAGGGGSAGAALPDPGSLQADAAAGSPVVS